MPTATKPAKVAEPVIQLKRTGGVQPDGVYRGRVDKAENKVGPKGPYINFSQKIDGVSGTVFDIISYADSHRFKMEAFLDSIGAPKEGKPWTVKQLHGKWFYCILSSESFQGRAKNVITTYVTEEIAKQLQETPSQINDAAVQAAFGDDGAGLFDTLGDDESDLDDPDEWDEDAEVGTSADEDDIPFH